MLIYYRNEKVLEDFFMLKIGVIGYGGRIHQVVSLLLKNEKCELASIADLNLDTVKERFPYLNEKENVNYYHSADEMLEKEHLDGVLIGTNCDTHAKYALLCSKHGIPMFLEKPVCTTYEDLKLLKSILHMDKKDKILGKWSPNWEGQFKIVQVYSNVAYEIEELTPEKRTLGINGKYLKKYKPILLEVKISAE
jgi:hypothetical protein